MKKILPVIFVLLFAACSAPVAPSAAATASPRSLASHTPAPPTPRPTITPVTPTITLTATLTAEPSITPRPAVPPFTHIAIVILENKEFGSVVQSNLMPNFNSYASQFTLLTQYYAPTHPSLPNYLSLIGGDTFGITTDCIHCYVDAPSLPDLIEKAGLTWKTYQERMPNPCFLGDSYKYYQKHNPFIYFTAIRENQARCNKSIVPLTQLDADIAANALPNFIFISPDICNSGHDCPIDTVDAWLGDMVTKLRGAMDATSQPYLIVVTFDEGQGDHSCCGLPDLAGGRVATILISPQARSGFQDDTPYTHYSLLKTILTAWNLPPLGKTADAGNVVITAPWK